MNTPSLFFKMSVLLILASPFVNSAFAQNSLPPPGYGSLKPRHNPFWGNPFLNNPQMIPPFSINRPLSSPDWQNNGYENVIAVGSGAQGVWRSIPLNISYSFNGAQYNVTVINAYNPWSQSWMNGIYIPAYSTYIFLKGTYYKYCVDLSVGTFYFNI